MSHQFPNIMKQIEAGTETILDGYIRFLNPNVPNESLSVLRNSNVFSGDIPFATTAFGDIFTWTEDGYIRFYKLVDGISTIIMFGDKFFFQNVEDADFQSEYFDINLYYQAKSKYGPLSQNQCYTFVPIPALGGAKKLESIQTGDLSAYLLLLLNNF